MSAVCDAPERLSEAFCDESWLSRFPLLDATVLDYFTISPFFSVEGLRAPGLDAASALSSGIEYRLRGGWEATPGLFVIERVLRKRVGTAAHSQLTSAVLSVYYCLFGVIYQCPDLATLLSARVEKASFHLAAAMEAYEAARDEAAGGGGGAAGGSGGVGHVGALAAARAAALPPSALMRLTHDIRVEDILRFTPL